ncbi:MAG: ribosomal protein S18-alanine N-acetyltransferase [Acidimicrobiales bacterium]
MGNPLMPLRQPGVGGDGPLSVHLAPMRRRHLRRVLEIEHKVYPNPWTLGLFLSELGQPRDRFYVVARITGKVAGYAGLMIGYEESHVTNIAVDPSWQRHQVATRLLINLHGAALKHSTRNMTLEVRLSNAPAQAMYRQFGFETEGIRKNYYVENQEDALVMWAHDIDSDAYLRRIEQIKSAIRGVTVDETGVAAL